MKPAEVTPAVFEGLATELVEVPGGARCGHRPPTWPVSRSCRGFASFGVARESASHWRSLGRGEVHLNGELLHAIDPTAKGRLRRAFTV